MKFPKIDWNAFTWLVRTPDALFIRQDATAGVRSGLLNSYTWNSATDELTGFTSHNSLDDVGTDFEIFGPDLIFGARAYWYRGGEYLSRYSGSCAWNIENLEELVHRDIALITAELLDVPSFFAPSENALFYAGGRALLTSVQLDFWNTFFVQLPEVAFTFEGVPFYGSSQSVVANEKWVSLRDVLQRVACYWLPFFQSRGNVGTVQDLNYFRPLEILNQFANLDPATWPAITTLYKPTAIELAASVALSPGFLFGFVSDPRSPLFDRFTCFEGAEFSEDGDNQPFLQSVPWELSSGSEVVAEVAHVNRFERTNENETLPEWIELELVRV